MKIGINYIMVDDKLWGSDGSIIDPLERFRNMSIKGTLENKLYEKYKNCTLSEFLDLTSVK